MLRYNDNRKSSNKLSLFISEQSNFCYKVSIFYGIIQLLCHITNIILKYSKYNTSITTRSISMRH